MAADNLIPAADKWQFDQAVTDVFPQMLENSIPGYHEMRKLVREIGERHIGLPLHPPTIVDLGASRGDTIAPYVGKRNRCFAIDNSPEMCAAMRERFGDDPTVDIYEASIQDTVGYAYESVDLIHAVLTLQFIPIEYRQRVMTNIYNWLKPGGMFIFVEKILGSSTDMNDLLVEHYYQMKIDNGYTWDAIHTKRKSLEGVLTPLTARWNEDLLTDAGFTHIEPFWRNLNFCGWVAIK